MLYIVVGLVVYVFLFLIGFNFVRHNNQQAYIKFSLIGLVLMMFIQCGFVYILNNPSNLTHYQGVVKRLWIDTRARTETYSCGNSTCTRTVYENHYMVDGAYGNGVCTDELSHSDWKSLSENDDYVCSINEANFMLFNKDRFHTSKAIKKQYEKSPLIKSGFFSKFGKTDKVGGYSFVHSDNGIVNWQDYQRILRDFNMMKRYSVEMYLTTSNQDIVSAIKENRSGANVNQILMIYGVKGQKIDWLEVMTFAENEDNHKLVADLNSKYAVKKDLSFNQENVLADLDFIKTNYKAVDNARFQYLQDNHKHKNGFNVLLFSCFLQIAFIIFLTRRF